MTGEEARAFLYTRPPKDLTDLESAMQSVIIETARVIIETTRKVKSVADDLEKLKVEMRLLKRQLRTAAEDL